MAHQTQGAVDSLVGLLSTAIKDEARLLGGIQGDMQFIKDEMESMNGFLLHLTRTDGVHDDQLRAWMKQIREIAYIAQDYIELYVRDFAGPSNTGLWSLLRHLPALLRSLPARHHLANKIRELKVRVHDVGERRQRYDISIPKAETPPQRLAEGPTSQDKIDEDREEFVRKLARDKEKQQQQGVPSFDEAIRLITRDLRSAATKVLHDGLKDFWLQDHDVATICMEMLLRALRAHSPVSLMVEKTKKELDKLVKDKDIIDLRSEVMIFCYSKLSTSCKSCLQYLYAFHDEAAISRTSLVRRWLADGRVEKQDDLSLEEAAELNFKELLFRGFLLPLDPPGTTSKVKSCKVDKTVWDFVYRISASENFVNNLPYHLDNQVRIRRFVKRQEELRKNPRPREVVDGPWSICGFRRQTRPQDDSTTTDPMEDMVKFLNSLDPIYRLNVLDLGGCRGLKKSHLKSICNVLSLKYLSLRKTGVSRLPKHINKLRLLETLDIRQTQVWPRDTKHIYLPKLKHLLTNPTMTEKETLWAWMPHKIGRMKHMEILSRVLVQYDHTAAKQELEEVGRLQQLRKLGVVLVGSSEAQENMKNLLRAITKLSVCLRSLSVWIIPPPTNGETVKMDMTTEHSPPKFLKSLNIRGVSFRNNGLPSWIRKLEQLSEITLCDTLLSKDSLQDLGKDLHHLRCLRLRPKSYSDPKLTFSKDGFQDLRFLIIEGDIITTVDFEEDGTAPQLKKIVWYNMPPNQAGTLSGIDLLPRLEEVQLKGDITNSSPIPARLRSPSLRNLLGYGCVLFGFSSGFSQKPPPQILKLV